MDRFKYVDFFAGAGLVDAALHRQWACTWANDIDARKHEIYQRNFGNANFVLDDINHVSVSDLPTGIDMAWASFPCQDLSLAGWRRGMSAERSGTFWAFWKLMHDLQVDGERPPIIVIENVTGLLYGDNFTGLCEALSALGMQFGALVIDAKQFLPQSRPRVFIVAVDSRIDVDSLTTDWPERSPWIPKALWNAWKDLPDASKAKWRWWDLPVPSDPVQPIVNLIESEPTSGGWHSSEETTRLLGMMSSTNLEKVKQVQLSGYPAVGFVYKRTRAGTQRAEVRFDGIAGCLRTPGGGSSRQTILSVKGEEVRSRLLSTREAARLMGLPDSFWLPERYNDAYRAMGDGVAVPAVEWLSTHVLLPLAERCAVCSDDVRGNITHQDTEASRGKAYALAASWSKSLS